MHVVSILEPGKARQAVRDWGSVLQNANMPRIAAQASVDAMLCFHTGHSAGKMGVCTCIWQNRGRGIYHVYIGQYCKINVPTRNRGRVMYIGQYSKCRGCKLLHVG